MKNLKKLGEALTKQEQQKINGGTGYTIVCNFSDGTSWEAHTHNENTAAHIMTNCDINGGQHSVHAHLDIVDWLVHH